MMTKTRNKKDLKQEQLDELNTLASLGNLTLKNIVDLAADPASALHNLFEWDRDKAHRKYLLVQAGEILRKYKVYKTVWIDEHPVEVKYNRFIPTLNQSYEPIETVLDDKAKTQQEVDACFRSLRAWIRKTLHLYQITGRDVKEILRACLDELED